MSQFLSILTTQNGPWFLNQAIGEFGSNGVRPGNDVELGPTFPFDVWIIGGSAFYNFTDGGGSLTDFQIELRNSDAPGSPIPLFNGQVGTNSTINILADPVFIPANNRVTLQSVDNGPVKSNKFIASIWYTPDQVGLKAFFAPTFQSFGSLLPSTFPFGWGDGSGTPLPGTEITIPVNCSLIGISLTGNSNINGVLGTDLLIEINRNGVLDLNLTLPGASRSAIATQPIGLFPYSAGDTVQVQCQSTIPGAQGVVGMLMFSED